MKNIFDAADVQEMVDRIDKLTPQSQPIWGKMTVSQMLAHCSVSYEMVYEDKHPKPNAFAKLFIKAFVKNAVVGPKPYKRNTPTAPAFKMTGDKDFDAEKKRLVHYLHKTQQLGEAYFDGRESLSFGKLTISEWNILFYKHLDHHLQQFGA